MTLPSFTPGMSFDQAAQAVLEYLREHVPMGFWAVTRVENDRQTYLYLGENSYGLEQGGHHPWADSFCVRMVAGDGPPVAPDAQAVPAYAEAGINALAPIGAYAGAGIVEPDGTLFGAVCGIHPESRADDASLAAAGPLLALLGQLLTMVLASDRQRQVADAHVLDARLAAETDVLTGLYNRRAWEGLLEQEEQAFARFGDPTVLAVLDLDRLKEVNDSLGHAAGDDYIRRSATVLATSVRDSDVVARMGGDEFGILMRGCDERAAGRRVTTLYDALTDAGVAGSIGWAPITVLRGFPAALADADQAMYDAKRARRAGRLAPVADPDLAPAPHPVG